MSFVVVLNSEPSTSVVLAKYRFDDLYFEPFFPSTTTMCSESSEHAWGARKIASTSYRCSGLFRYYVHLHFPVLLLLFSSYDFLLLFSSFDFSALPSHFFNFSCDFFGSEVFPLLVDDVMARAEEQRPQGIENPDHEAIFMELYGKVKKRKQISGAGQAIGIYFPLATNSSVGSAPMNASQIDEIVEQRVKESREQMQLQIEKGQTDSDKKIAMVREEADKREQQMEERMMRLFNEKFRQK